MFAARILGPVHEDELQRLEADAKAHAPSFISTREPGVRVPELLTIAVAQPLSVSYDIAANARMHSAMVREAGARVVVFPELSLTGYELDAPAITGEDAD